MSSAAVTVCAAALVCSLLSAFVPEGATKKTVSLVIGAFMVCCLISPISSAISSVDFNAEIPDDYSYAVSSSDEAYASAVLSEAEKNLEQSLADILLQNAIVISDCKIVLAKSQAESIIIGDISIYISSEYSNQTDKIGKLTYESFGVYPRITLI